MADAPFDPSGAVTFDLSSGRVSLAHASPRVLAPADGLARLCEAAGENATREFGSAIGTAMGARLAQHLGGMREVSMERFVEHLRGEFALAGFGVVGMELWGDALLFVVEHAFMPPSLVASVLDGALAGATGRSVVCVKLAESEGQTRFLVTGQQGAARVAGWVAEGVAWGEVLVRLHARGDRKSGGEA
jgi:hypothetical protein